MRNHHHQSIQGIDRKVIDRIVPKPGSQTGNALRWKNRPCRRIVPVYSSVRSNPHPVRTIGNKTNYSVVRQTKTVVRVMMIHLKRIAVKPVKPVSSAEP